MRTWLLGDPRPSDLISDRTFTHGLGVFETILAVDGSLVRADLHFKRLRKGCERLGIEVPDEEVLRAELRAAVAEASASRLRVRIMQTAGSGGVRELSGGSMQTVLSVGTIGETPDTLSVATSPWPRNESSPLVGVKCSSYAENLVALDHARRMGVDELIFPNTSQMLCEAAAANVFLVREGGLLTPPLASGCLPGTTRLRVMEWASSLGISCEERQISMDEAKEADGLLLTSAIRGVSWVRQWDERKYSDRRLADQLADAFECSLVGE